MPAPYSVLKDGNATLTAAGTCQQLVSKTTPCAKIIITAAAANLGTISIGAATVVGALGSTQRGVFLTAEGSVQLEIDDLSKILFDGTSSGDMITYSYLA